MDRANFITEERIDFPDCDEDALQENEDRFPEDEVVSPLEEPRSHYPACWEDKYFKYRKASNATDSIVSMNFDDWNSGSFLDEVIARLVARRNGLFKLFLEEKTSELDDKLRSIDAKIDNLRLSQYHASDFFQSVLKVDEKFESNKENLRKLLLSLKTEYGKKKS